MKTLISIFTLCLSSIALGQSHGVAYPAVGKGVATTFVNDYHSLGINTSMLGFGTGYEGKRFTLGTTEYSAGLHTNQTELSFEGIKNSFFDNTVSLDEQRETAKNFINNGLTLDANINWLGFAFQNEKFGGIAVSIQEKYNIHTTLSNDLSELIVNGKFSQLFPQLNIRDLNGIESIISNSENLPSDTNALVQSGIFANPTRLSTLTNGTEISFAWNRHYNIGYGRKIFGDSTFALYGGIGARYISSMAYFSFISDEDGMTMNSALSSFFDIDYGPFGENNASADHNKTTFPTPAGSGYGLDFSATALLFKRLKVSVAVNNIGKVNYNRNVYNIQDTLLTEVSLPGIDHADIAQSPQYLLENGGILNLVGQEKISVNNASDIRIGGSLSFGKIAQIGVDVVAPFNSENPGSIQNAVYSVGGEVRPVKWLALSAGYFGGGVYKHNIPLGIQFIFGDGSFECGISSRDALSFFTKNSNSVSMAMGLMRVRF